MALLQISEPGDSPEPHQRKLAVGIDLGTTHSLVATVRSSSADVLADAEGRLIGLELVCRDGTRRFLPAGAADIRAGEIRVASALVFLDERELDWYRGRMTAA